MKPMQMNSPPRVAYSVPEAMLALGLCRDSIYKLINSGQLPAKKIGRRTLIVRSDLEKFLSSLPPIGGAA
jgi:excisionase family DNA binding protein